MQEAKMGLRAEVVGEVSEVEPEAKYCVVHSNSRVRGAKELNLRVRVTDQTSIKEGKEARSFDDIRIGDRVWLRYDRKGGALIAESIVIKSHEKSHEE